MTIELLDTEEAQTEDPVEVQVRTGARTRSPAHTLGLQGQPQAAPSRGGSHPRSLCFTGQARTSTREPLLLAEHWPRSPKRRGLSRCSLRDQGCVPGQEGYVGASLASTQTLAPSTSSYARPSPRNRGSLVTSPRGVWLLHTWRPAQSSGRAHHQGRERSWPTRTCTFPWVPLSQEAGPGSLQLPSQSWGRPPPQPPKCPHSVLHRTHFP